MVHQNIPDLTFPSVEYDQRTPWNLQALLYCGGGSTNVKLVDDLITNGKLGNPLVERISLLQRIHEEISADLRGGGSLKTAQNHIWNLRKFFAWADTTGQPMTLGSSADAFVKYADHLLHRVRVGRSLAEASAYAYVTTLSKLLDRALERKTSLLLNIRLGKPGTKKRVLGTQADKQNLATTFTFGRALLDICDALTVEIIQGPLPVAIRLRTGQTTEEWCSLIAPHKVKSLADGANAHNRKTTIQRRAAWADDTSPRTRYPLINLRIEAEMLIFIAQTGINLAQAYALKIGNFRYQSYLDGYRIYRVHKGRRCGEVAFEIYSEYKQQFERYLAWRTAIFPSNNEHLLFPHAQPIGRTRSRLGSPDFDALKRRCKLFGISFVGPQKLRKTRVNWLLRLTQDPSLTAEMDQHTQETLLRDYEQPHHQVAIAEISQFHTRMDPSIAMPGPGVCIEAVPSAIPDIAPQTPTPDCVSPAGCLFCQHHRDLDSGEYVWSLATYRHFKSLELARYRSLEDGSRPHPAKAVIDRITAKLRRFKMGSEVRARWVQEALARVDEGDFHPKWAGFIGLTEVSS